MPNKGLIRISLQPKRLAPELAARFFAPALEGIAPGVSAALPESFLSAARRHLRTVFREAAPAGFAVAGAVAAPPPELLEDAVQEAPLTQTVVAAFKQAHRGVPIYGASVGVEMSQNRELLDVSGHLTPGPDVSPIAKLAPAEAWSIAKRIAHIPEDAPMAEPEAPQLNYWFDDRTEEGEWRLVYLFSHILAFTARGGEGADDAPGVPSKIVVDANSGERVAVIPLRHSLTAVPARGVDADGKEHLFTAGQISTNRFVLEDPVRRIKTLSMDFNDISCGPKDLPGDPVTSASANFASPAAVVAHANATKVYDFFSNVFRRNSIDGHGMEVISAVECLSYRATRFGCRPIDPNVKEYQNAAWIRDTDPRYPAVIRTGLMVYGQTRWPDGKYHSFAESLDVVGHELTHGITDYSGGLDYEVESGALNESYSDIFGAAISNAHLSSVAGWDWAIGEELSASGDPTRNVADPRRGDPPQPAHMNDFMRLRPGEEPDGGNDNGYVHGNSGIHNKAAYNLFLRAEFTWQQVIQMFYLTLTTPGRLHPRAKFSDSRAGVVASCHSLFRNDPSLPQKVAAVEAAFSAVGIQ